MIQTRDQSGQMLLVGALIFVVLLITIPVIIFVNNTISRHSVESQQKLKGRALAEQGIAFGMQQLSSSTIMGNPAQSLGEPSPGGPLNNNNADFISQNVPAFMAPNQTIPVTLTFRNSGANRWPPGSRFRLGMRNPQDTPIWGLTDDPRLNRVFLDPGDDILPNQFKTFYFTITAPSVPGPYNFQVGMLNEPTDGDEHWFGQFSPSLTVSVVPNPATQSNWPYFSGSRMPLPLTMESPQGGTFQIVYTSTTGDIPSLLPYQVRITAIPRNAAGHIIPDAALTATVSQRTLGARTPSGLGAPAALELMYPPQEIGNGQMRVEFGSIVVRSTDTWNLGSLISSTRRPRKFSLGGITSRSVDPERKSDQKEFWAYTSPGVPMVIDTAYYIGQAKRTSCPTGPVCAGGDCTADPPNSCYYPRVGGGTAVFRNFSFLTDDGTDKFVYVNGSAQFERYTANLASGAFVVTGNLILGNNNQNAASSITTYLHIPPNLGAEDPYCTCGDVMCIGAVNRHIDFQGFLYVKGGLHADKAVGIPSDPNNWTINGAVRVEGNFALESATSLYLFYNDVISHRIRTNSFEVQIDSMTVLP